MSDEIGTAFISNLNRTEIRARNHRPCAINFHQRISVATNNLKKQYVPVINANN
jgi:hypothetical protein